MKKIALATLLAAASIVASAQVSVSGKVAEFIDNTKVGAVSKTSIAGEPTNNITVSVTEALGNGLKARAVIDTSLGTNSINGGSYTQFGDRQGTVGLVSSTGSVDIGRNVHSEFLAITNNDVFGTMYGSVAGDVHNLRGLRLSNGVFATVTPIAGVTVSYDRTQGNVGAEALSYSGTGSFAGITATAARFEQGLDKSTVVAANAKLGNTKVTYIHSDDATGLIAIRPFPLVATTTIAKSTGDSVGVAQSFGPFTAKASYGRTNTKTTAYSAGVGYAFSKRTDVEVAYRNVNAVGTANDVAQVGVGVIHRF
jgi:predicted porin